MAEVSKPTESQTVLLQAALIRTPINRLSLADSIAG
jgi:hypothetical protein